MRTLTMSFPAYRGSPEAYGRHCNNFHPESLINILRIYVFVTFNYVIFWRTAVRWKFMEELILDTAIIFAMFIEIYSILQNHFLEPVPMQFFCCYELLLLS